MPPRSQVEFQVELIRRIEGSLKGALEAYFIHESFLFTGAEAGNLMSTKAASFPELDLIGRVGQRDRTAFSELYDRYSQLVMNVAWRILKEQQEVVDLASLPF